MNYGGSIAKLGWIEWWQSLVAFRVTYRPCRQELRAPTEETREAREDGTDRSIDRGTTKPLSASGVQTQGKLFLLVQVGLLCRKSQGRPCSSTSWQDVHPTLYLIVVSEPLLSIQSLKNGVEKMSEGGEKFIIIKIICNCNVIAKMCNHLNYFVYRVDWPKFFLLWMI